MITLADIDPGTILALLLDPGRRRELVDAVDRERGRRLPLTNALGEAARRARATPDELRRIAQVLEADHLEDWLAGFVFHPQMPEEVLLDLCERGVCTDALGHRAGPRRLLQRVVELHEYPEAILSLAIDLYRDPAVPAAELGAFVRAHAKHEWMLRALAELEGSDEAKEEIYEGLLAGSPDAMCFHARHLAGVERCSVELLARYLARHPEPRALALLLRTRIEDPDKRALVIRLAEACRDDPAVAEALALRRACDAAAAEDLTPEAATELFAAGAPDVLLVLAGNPRTPPVLLRRLVEHKGTVSAREIRRRARERLGGRQGPG